MKKNIIKIPKLIKFQLKKLGQYIVVATSKKYTAKEISEGKLDHLGISISGSKLIIPESVIPSETIGKYSNRNINGYEVIRKDLPKETHYNTVEAPNWGDDYNGTHSVDLPYKKYPRDFYAPKNARLRIISSSDDVVKGEFILAFEIDFILDQKKKNFEKELLFMLNILQENIGICGVKNSKTSLDEYLQSIQVSWEVLPPGTKEEAVQHIFKGRTPSKEEKEVAEKRYDFLMSLNPEKLIYGTSGLQRYFGALLEEDLVVFENIRYGNAIYIMFKDWEELSKKSRLELMSGRFGDNFERVIHTSGWKGRVRQIIEKKRD